MMTWERYNIPNEAGRLPLDGGGAKLILHTTEGDYPAGEKEKMRNRDLGAFDRLHNGVHSSWMAGKGYPAHFLITAPTRRVYQYFDLDRGAVTLDDNNGPAFRPNRAGSRVVQIEMVGHADSLLVEYSDADWLWLRDTFKEICRQAGIPYAYADIRKGARRMGEAEFKAFAGICGHQHAPENNHWDPGDIRLDLLTSEGNQASDDMSELMFLTISGPAGLATLLGSTHVQPGGGLAFGWVRWIGPNDYVTYVNAPFNTRSWNDVYNGGQPLNANGVNTGLFLMGNFPPGTTEANFAPGSGRLKGDTGPQGIPGSPGIPGAPAPVTNVNTEAIIEAAVQRVIARLANG